MNRRQFLKRALHATGGSLLACLAGPAYTSWVEPRWLRLEQMRIDLVGLPARLDGLRLALLSDLHVGPHVATRHVDAAIDLALSTAPDAVVLAGDMISSADAIDDCSAAVTRLTAPHGVYACLGNHDHWTDPEAVTQALYAAGVEVLRNRAVELGHGLWLAGVDDVWQHQADLGAALERVPPGAPVVLLAHEPDFADRVAADGRVALQLSGHTHGGQVRLPGVGPLVLPYLGRRYPAGLYRVNRMQLYITRGVGLVAPAVRFNCRPEVTLLELHAA